MIVSTHDRRFSEITDYEYVFEDNLNQKTKLAD